ncbi:S8 family serine peptidase [Actinoallomurus purpureus]|uniref:S8 family serine peptidase n=1 Tax=Actinoallomurus purpureus TaxID=478114 RepID=UPI0020933F43|nr:S8 family serine peptidase [Actinoallomurus purpureus]MCO6004348.1 S8 family serine peptidase [Actinoallomurus purpureus]
MRRLRAGVAITVAGAVVAGVPVTAHAAPAVRTTTTPKTTAASRLPADRSWKVTLITGDVVEVRTVRNRPSLVSVKPGAGREKIPFVKDIRPDGTIRVTPLDVRSRVGTVYDPALFDVTTLIEDGDDDARSSTLPLIVRGGASVRALASGHRSLSSIGATAVRQPKGNGPALARSAPAEGVTRIWLDRKVRAQALDHNLQQIGAPTAWKAGATGKGVKVAILDTGVDATHPDLKGRIAEQKNFSQAKDTVDHVGHGTHVAATIAGTGASANGERKGVAPDANLLIGKVLGDDGGGRDSDVIAGMEWASGKARIVSMSLGGYSEDPANDPAAKAVETLTAKNKTLFVIAAGNSGPSPASIETPGIAPSALTVGAVDGADKVADFSSRGGPVMKPEISAPGVDVIAARAKGTAMGTVIDARYTSASGTSMATPHVAGAAADLLQKHPSWTPARLKATLVTTAHQAPGTVYQVGAGRLDVGVASRATVVGDQPTVAFGSVPRGSTKALTQRLSWTNSGSAAATLKLAAQLASPAGKAVKGIGLPATVSVPAGGSASVTLTLDPRVLTTAGGYSGAVTATASGVALRVPVGVVAEPETHTLTLKATPIPGTPEGALGGNVGVVNLDDPDLYDGGVEIPADGVARLTVPVGRYAVLGTVDDTTKGKQRSAFTGDAELTVHGDTTLSLDASKARPVRLSAADAKIDPSAAQGLQVERSVGDGGVWGSGVNAFDGSPMVYSTAVGGVRTGTFRAYAFARLTDGGKTVYDLLRDLGPKVPAEVNYTAAAKDLARVNERFGALNGDTSKPDGEKRYGVTPGGFLATEAESKVPAGSTRTDYVTGVGGVRWLDEAFPPDLGQASWVTQVPIRQYTAGETYTSAWVRQPFRPGPYSATGATASFCAPSASTRARGNIHVELVDLQNLPDGFDCLTDDEDWGKVSSRTMKLYAGDRLAGTVAASHGDFSAPAAAGTYRLVYTVDASKALSVSSKTSTTWTFRSKPGETRVPLLTVDYALPLDLLNHPNGEVATFTVARVKGATTAKADGLKLWTSLDDGTTWRPATVTTGTGGKYTAELPKVTKGQGVSLRVQATDNGGGKIDQTIIRAYTGG